MEIARTETLKKKEYVAVEAQNRLFERATKSEKRFKE